MDPENNSKTEYAVIGTRPIRHDGYDKVTGRAMFGADVSVPGLIWGEILRSPHAHARIIHIDTSKAEQAPGVFAVVTRADFPSLASIEKSHGLTASALIAKSPICWRKTRFSIGVTESPRSRLLTGTPLSKQRS